MNKLEMYDRIVGMQPDQNGVCGSSFEYSKNFEPGSREVIIAYTQIPGYRSGRKRPSWGFAISDASATRSWFNQYTCPRASARRVYQELKTTAEERGFVVHLEIDLETGLTEANLI